MSRAIFGPTFEEMLDPSVIDPAVCQRAVKAMTESPLDPINLYNISWRGTDDRIRLERGRQSMGRVINFVANRDRRDEWLEKLFARRLL